LNIIGQDISGFGLDLYGQRKLPDLLRKLAKKAKHIDGSGFFIFIRMRL